MTRISILYDGWPLIYQPDSPEALHLMAILSCHLEETQTELALPGQPPAWLPVGVRLHALPTADTPRDRLAWEQRTLPGLRKRIEAALLHLTSPNPPLFGPPLNLVSPSTFEAGPYGAGFASGGNFARGGGFTSRLRLAVSQGGMARIRGLFWPDDLPSPDWKGPLYRLPPTVFPGFPELSPSPEDIRQAAVLDLPEAYVLYHGPSDAKVLHQLLNAWSWVVDPMGEAYPLLTIGLGKAGGDRLVALAAEYGLGKSIRSLAGLSPGALDVTYRRSSALLHPTMEPPWGGPVRMAMASGTPVVAFESEQMSALVGPAAYLVKPGDGRALAAALITILVEERLAEQVALAGRLRAAAWSQSAFARGLAQAYRDILKN